MLNHAFTGDDPNDFVVTSTSAGSCTTPIEPGATCTMAYAFAPTAMGYRSAYLTINTTSVNPVIGILLTGQGLEATAGPITLSSSTLTFLTAGTPTDVTLTNSGSSALTIDGINIGNDPTSGQPAFTQTNTCGASLAAKGTCTISVSAVSTAQLYSTGVLSVADDAAGGPQKANLVFTNGFAGSHGIVIDFGSRSLGTQGVGGINGVGGGLNQTLNFTISGVNAADFTVDPAYSSCTIIRNSPTCGTTVYFNPSALGVRVATLNVNGVPFGGVTGIGLPVGVQFTTYLGPALADSWDFFQLDIGKTSSLSVTIKNTGTVPLVLNPPALSGPGSADYSVMSQCPASVAPNGNCNVVVTVAPTQPTYRFATLTLSDSTNTVQKTVSLKALGENPPPVANPTTLNFYSTPVGTVSSPQSFTVTSYNNDPVSVSIYDAPYLPFVLTGAKACAQTPCQISVAFAPTATIGASGTSYDNVQVVDLFSGETATVSVSGTTQPPPPVYSLNVAPTSLTFAAQTVGTTSAAQTISVTNTGNQPATFSLTVPGNTDYSIVNNCGATIGVGANCTVSVVFLPTAVGSRPGSVSFTSNAYFFGSVTSPYYIPFTGTGQ
jgi:hypothetical protein